MVLKEKTINLAEISKHSYLRKSKTKVNENKEEENLSFKMIEIHKKEE